MEEKYSLYRIVEDGILPQLKAKGNKNKYFKYGYDEKYDFVCISKDGTIGDIYEINGVRIALPSQPKNIHKGNNKWTPKEYPKELQKIKTIFDWQKRDNAFKSKYVDFIEQEFEKRDEGHWFMNNNVPTYITGSHYMYLQWSKIDVGLPDFREANRIFFIYWEACKADNRCFGMIYLKNRRSGFSFMSSCEIGNQGTLAKDSRLGILSKTGNDAKKMFTDKVVPIVNNYPFFFQPVRDGMTNPKTELAFRVPASKITKKNMNEESSEDIEGLDTTIDWKNTDDNSYDGEKLLMLVHDECYDPETLILTEGLIFKKIKDINVGDKVIIDGGKLKTVVKKTSGITDRYLIKQKWSEDYIVTENHRLILKHYALDKSDGKYKHKEIIITPKEYLSLNNNFKKHLFSVKSSPLLFNDNGLSIPPYLLGLWLGDGISASMSIVVNTEKDPEILSYLGRYCQMNCIEYNLYTIKKGKLLVFNILKRNVELRKLNVYNNKHIPSNYMTSSIESRLQLLAGIIDTDGYYHKKKNQVEIAMSRKDLVDQIRILAASCGLNCSVLKYKKSNFDTDIYRFYISGDMSIIPTLVERKRFDDCESYYSDRRCGMDVVPIGKGDYVGIQVDGETDAERRLILNDFTVSLNSGKWVKPLDILNNWRVTKTCLRLGSRIIGKCMMGSTSNALAKGGENYKKLYYDSDPRKRNANSQTKSGLYSLFIPMEWNFEGYIDEFGHPVFHTPSKPVVGADGMMIKMGVIEYWNNEVESLKSDADALNEFYRQFPRTESHAFRDESKESLFNLTKIYQQIDFNDGLHKEKYLTKGNFHWKNGVLDSEVVFTPEKSGRFLISWFPDQNTRNNVFTKNGKKYPGNEHLGAFGCDPYDISGVVGGGGSNGALHGKTGYHMEENAPVNQFFLEYIARPQTAEIFFEDVLMACVFYGMPLLAENNKPRLLYHFKNRGYRGFSMNRPDKNKLKLSKTEMELGGIPNTSEDVKQAHAAAIESYIEEYVGLDTEGTYRDSEVMGDMYFNRTLEDWARFNINDRTKHDASISSGLAIMATRKYNLSNQEQKSKISVKFATYNNRGSQSRFI